MVALTRSVVSVTCSPPGAELAAAAGAVGAAADVAVAALGTAAPGAGPLLGTAAVPCGGADAVALGRAGVPPNSVGAPVCLFQASHNRTSDITKTTHSRVRRISV